MLIILKMTVIFGDSFFLKIKIFRNFKKGWSVMSRARTCARFAVARQSPPTGVNSRARSLAQVVGSALLSRKGLCVW